LTQCIGGWDNPNQLTLLRFIVIFNQYCYQILKVLTEVDVAYRITEECINCGTCIDQCPEGAISQGDGISVLKEGCYGNGKIVIG